MTSAEGDDGREGGRKWASARREMEALRGYDGRTGASRAEVIRCHYTNLEEQVEAEVIGTLHKKPKIIIIIII